MNDLDLIYLLELFTLRSSKEYDYGLVVRCRRFILSIYREFSPCLVSQCTPIQLFDFINYVYKRALNLPHDEFLFIRSFRKYILRLTKMK